MKSSKIFFLIPILIIGSFFRFFLLNSQPPGLNWDEAALGYNAYSLLMTGKDEHSQPFPLIFKSFGDYKPGLYIWLTVLPVKILGLSEFSTRLPAAIVGIASIVMIYVLVCTLFPQQSKSKFNVGHIAALLYALNPWSIQYSRGAWESGVMVFFLMMAITFFLRHKVTLSGLFFVLSLWTYQSAKMLLPLILCALLMIYQKNKFQTIGTIKKLVIAIFLGALLMSLGNTEQFNRLKVYSVFSYKRSTETVNEILKQDNISQKNLTYLIFHSEILDQIRGVIQRYTNHFSPRFLFFEGDWSNLRNNIPFYGYFHPIEIVTMVIGFAQLSKKLRSKSVLFLIIFCIIAPIPAALSRDIVSGVRALSLVVPLTIISALGLYSIKNNIYKIILVIGVMVCFVYWSDMYFIHSRYYTSEAWLGIYKEVIHTIQEQNNKYQHVVVSDKLGQPYIFVLFYLQIPPAIYQKQHQFVKSEVGDVGQIQTFGKYEFRKIYWPNDRSLTSTMFAGDSFDLPEADLQSTRNIQRIEEIKFQSKGATDWKIVGLP